MRFEVALRRDYAKSKTAGANATGEGMSKLESQVVNGKVVDIHGSWRNSGRKLQPGIPTLVVYWRSAQSRVQAYSLTGTDRAAYSRTAPNSLSLSSLSVPPSPFPLLSLSPWDAANLRQSSTLV